VVLDPISAFVGSADALEVQSMLLRVVDYLKADGITGVFTPLLHSQSAIETDAGLSSLMDAWVLLLNREASGEFNRELYLLKARGTAHSNQVREFVMSSEGISLKPPYVGEGVALTGAARRAEEARTRREEVARAVEVERLKAQVAAKRARAMAEIEMLQSEVAADEAELARMSRAEEDYRTQHQSDLADMARTRRI
jgi:circadian clock protein KaiC